jgi:hypothetical protein
MTSANKVLPLASASAGQLLHGATAIVGEQLRVESQELSGLPPGLPAHELQTNQQQVQLLDRSRTPTVAAHPTTFSL